jgi:phenylalanyl-tRNA synthetase beta chain
MLGRHSTFLIGCAGLQGLIGEMDVLRENPVVAEVEFEPPATAHIPQFAGLARFPSVARDVTLDVPRQVPWSGIEAAAARLPSPWRSSPEYVGTYAGKQLDRRQKAVTLRVRYRAPDRTLTDDEVNAEHEKFVNELCKEVGGSVRSAAGGAK